jgi:hypothetical protein
MDFICFRYDSLPAKIEDLKLEEPTVKLVSVLKKPGSGKSDRKSLKKVAFLESNY